MSVTWPGGIIHTLEISFTTDPLATSVWTDVSAYLMEIPNLQHGTTSEDGEIGPGTMTVVLENKDRRFDPDHATSPYAPNVKPMKAIRYRITLGAFSKTLFTGYIQGWPQRWNRRFFGTTQIQAISGNRLINNSTLYTSAYATEIYPDSPIRYWPLQTGFLDEIVEDDLPPDTNSAGWAEGAIGESTLPVGESAALVGDSVERALYTAVGDWTVMRGLEYWISVPSLSTASTNTTQVSARSSDGGIIVISFDAVNANWQLSYDNPTDNVRINTATDTTENGFFTGVHHVALRASATELTFMVDGSVALEHTFALASTGPSTVTELSTIVAVDGAVSHIALYATDPGTARMQEHYYAGAWAWTGAHGDYGFEYGGARINRILDDLVEGPWPAALRSIDTGQTLHGPYLPASGNALEAIRDVVRAECGVLCLNTDGDLTFIDRETLWTTADTGTIFSDDGSPAAAEFSDFTPDGNDVETIRNIVTTSYSTVGAITRRDQTSIDEFGASNQSDTCPTIPTADVASLRSAYVLREKKDPHTRITQLTCVLRGPVGTTAIAAQVSKVLSLEIGTVITVEHTPMGLGAQTVKKVMVLGIRHQISRKPMQWTTTLYLSPPPTSADDTPYLTLGDAVFGQIGAADGNLIPY